MVLLASNWKKKAETFTNSSILASFWQLLTVTYMQQSVVIGCTICQCRSSTVSQSARQPVSVIQLEEKLNLIELTKAQIYSSNAVRANTFQLDRWMTINHLSRDHNPVQKSRRPMGRPRKWQLLVGKRANGHRIALVNTMWLLYVLVDSLNTNNCQLTWYLTSTLYMTMSHIYECILMFIISKGAIFESMSLMPPPSSNVVRGRWFDGDFGVNQLIIQLFSNGDSIDRKTENKQTKIIFKCVNKSKSKNKWCDG